MAWAAVADFADELDPLGRPLEVARPIEFSDDELVEFVERLERQKQGKCRPHGRAKW